MKVKKGSMNHINLHKISINDPSFDTQKLEDYYKAGFIDITATDRCLKVLEELGRDFIGVDIKFGSIKHQILKEFKILDITFMYHVPVKIKELTKYEYVCNNKITQKGIDKLLEIEKDKSWSEKCLINTLTWPHGSFSVYMYKLRAIELGLLAKDSKDWLRLTEEGRNWLKERTEDALKKYKLDFSVITVLMGYINDVSILPSYLTSIDEDVRNAAKKRYDELKGDNK
jgi:hypothetical protein